MVDRTAARCHAISVCLGRSHALLPGAATHVLVPRVAARLAAASRLLLPPKGSPDLGTIGGNVDIYDATVRSRRPTQSAALGGGPFTLGAVIPGPGKDILQRLGKEAGAETLPHGIVNLDGVLEGGGPDDVDDGHKGLAQTGRVVPLHGHNGWRHIVARQLLDQLATKDDAAAVLLGLLQGLLVDVHGSRILQRPTQDALFKGTADLDLPIRGR